MDQHQNAPRPPACSGGRGDALDKILPALSVLTTALTVPQVWAVWVQGNTSGVSLLSRGPTSSPRACGWSTGCESTTRKIWVACIGWVLLDGAVFVGVLVHH